MLNIQNKFSTRSVLRFYSVISIDFKYKVIPETLSDLHDLCGGL